MRNSIRFVPIEAWPGKATTLQAPAKFRAGYNDTLKLLDGELSRISAKNIVIQAFFRPDQLRGDGWPYASARPSKSGVILGFSTAKGAFSFPCDRYAVFDDNLRAIALSLEALRAVDRYGVTQRAEQYQGWKQIEGPKPSFATAEEAAQFIATHAYGPGGRNAELTLTSQEFRQKAYRAAAMRLHPDKPETGNAEQFLLLQEALMLLAAQQGGSK